jgi:hypothetical protein
MCQEGCDNLAPDQDFTIICAAAHARPSAALEDRTTKSTSDEFKTADRITRFGIFYRTKGNNWLIVVTTSALNTYEGTQTQCHGRKVPRGRDLRNCIRLSVLGIQR